MKGTAYDGIVRLIRDHVDAEAIDRGRERMARVARNLRPDYLPIVISVEDSPLFEQFTVHNAEDEFYSLLAGSQLDTLETT